jgi:DNA polymerase
MTILLFRDIETFSRVDLKTVGAHRYAADPTTGVWCVGYAVDDGPAEIWIPGQQIPAPFIEAARNPEWLVVAHNDAFERTIEEHILYPRFDWLLVPLERHRCTMAMALAAALPGALDKAIAALSLPFAKDKAGAALMRRMAKPRPDGTWLADAASRERLYAYCQRDVEAERAIFRALPPLTADEQLVWELDAVINARGFATDGALLEAASKVVTAANASARAEFRGITGLESTNQVARFVAWLAEHGCSVEDVQKGTLKHALRRNGLAPEVQRAIELRLELAHASAAKVEALRAWRGEDGRVRGSLVFHGAATGRWVGRGPQPQNFKRDGENIGAKIEAVMNGTSCLASPVEAVGAIARAMIVAAPGCRLLVADFSGIESRVLAWVAGQGSKIAAWAKFDLTGDPSDDPYVIIGRSLGHPEASARAFGKIADLAFGYQGGVGAWQNFAPEDDASDEATIKQYRDRWRDQHPAVVQFWYATDRAAIRAIRHPDADYPVGRLTFRYEEPFLRIRLPSGRSLSYPFARIHLTDKYGNDRVSFLDNSGGKFADCRFGNGAYGGLWTENIVSAIARDLLAAALCRLEAAGYPVVLHVHDEIVAEAPDGFGGVEEFKQIIVALPEWATGLPVAAKVRNGPRFAKIAEPEAEENEPQDEDPIEEMCGRTDSTESPPRHDEGNGYASGEEPRGTTSDVYIYTNERGDPWLRVIRTSSHTFPTQHWKDGKWAKGWPPRGDPVYPFRLKECLAAPADLPVIVCEGEKDTLAAVALGFDCATCNHGGAGKWYAEHAKWFAGTRRAIIAEDNDPPGRAHAMKVAATLHVVGVPDIRIVRFPELPEHGDLSDWLALGHTPEEFLARAEAGPRYEPDQLEYAWASSFELRAVSWLWPNRFAIGKLGIIAGLPDEGKGLVLADMAARVTRAGTPGFEWPCGEGLPLPGGNVVLLSAEDDPNDTIIPRLIAAGADIHRIAVVSMVRVGGGQRMFSLVTDLELLRKTIDQIGDVKLVQIDPISAYLGVKKMDSYRTTDVRAVLAPVVNLAAELRIAIVGIMHFNKKTDVTNALLRISDSLAFGATARHVYAVVNDAENKRRLFVRGKNNLAPSDQQALAFTIALREVGTDAKNDTPVVVPHLVWQAEHVDVTATEAMQAANESKSPAARDNAKTFLKDMLSNGPVAAADVEEAAEANGIAERTLYRAKAELGIRAVKDGPMKDGQRTWRWHRGKE